MSARCIVCHAELATAPRPVLERPMFYCPTEGCMRYGLVTMMADHDVVKINGEKI